LTGNTGCYIVVSIVTRRKEMENERYLKSLLRGNSRHIMDYENYGPLEADDVQEVVAPKVECITVTNSKGRKFRFLSLEIAGKTFEECGFVIAKVNGVPFNKEKR